MSVMFGLQRKKNLHIWKGSINAERYKQVLEQHLLPSSGKALNISAGQS